MFSIADQLQIHCNFIEINCNSIANPFQTHCKPIEIHCKCIGHPMQIHAIADPLQIHRKSNANPFKHHCKSSGNQLDIDVPIQIPANSLQIHLNPLKINRKSYENLVKVNWKPIESHWTSIAKAFQIHCKSNWLDANPLKIQWKSIGKSIGNALTNPVKIFKILWKPSQIQENPNKSSTFWLKILRILWKPLEILENPNKSWKFLLKILRNSCEFIEKLLEIFPNLQRSRQIRDFP